MNSRTIISLLALLFVSVSAQYYYPYGSGYSGYYLNYAGYYPSSYAGYASAYPSYSGYGYAYPSYAGYSSYYPSMYYGYGSNKGVQSEQAPNPEVKLTNNNVRRF
uniref:Uncharacterized protein n=1 Tax=Parastrongyloides trichosuri TaxID=131310 RepID=A0A0N4ZZX0_PARTI